MTIHMHNASCADPRLCPYHSHYREEQRDRFIAEIADMEELPESLVQTNFERERNDLISRARALTNPTLQSKG
jgi:hypothetical protein